MCLRPPPDGRLPARASGARTTISHDMGLTSTFSGRRNAPAGTAGGSTSGADSVQQARTRARHRLIGAAVLVAVGLVLFPMVFESEPRPVSPDIPIEIARRETVEPADDRREPSRERAGMASQNGAAERQGVITETAAEAGREVMPPPAGAAVRPARSPAPASAPRAVAAAVVKPAPRPATAASAAKPVAAKPAASAPKTVVAVKPPPPAPAPAPAPPAPAPVPNATGATEPRSPARPAAATAEAPAANGEAKRAQMLLEGKEVDGPKAEKAEKPVDAPGTRYVIQVGAFADGGMAQAARLKVERLGMKTYTHVAKTPGGERTRVRVGPVTSREEAERLQARLKAAGMAAAVLTL